MTIASRLLIGRRCLKAGAQDRARRGKHLGQAKRNMMVQRFRQTVCDHITGQLAIGKLAEIILSIQTFDPTFPRVCPVAAGLATPTRAAMMHTHLFHRICIFAEADGDAPV
jgi:hypothetical protein